MELATVKKRIQNSIVFIFSTTMILTFLLGCGSGPSKSTVAIIDGEKIPGAYFLYTQPPGFPNQDRIDQINTLEKFYRIQLRAHDARNIGVLENDSLKYTILMRQEEAKMEALPPRTPSMRSTVSSTRKSRSMLVKASSGLS